ncbi:MAG: hypothetical protein GXX11_02095 [Acholeplasmataceae bacterium]|nr:hypothetical protein [Acholeplasmataceae bacterium]
MLSTDHCLDLMTISVKENANKTTDAIFDKLDIIDSLVAYERYQEIKKAFTVVAAVKAFGISKELDIYLATVVK